MRGLSVLILSTVFGFGESYFGKIPIFYYFLATMLKVKVRGFASIDDTVLLCKLAAYDFFCLPGGTMDGGEEREETLEREFIEELNIKPAIGPLLYINEFINSGVTTIDFRYDIKNPKDFLDIDLSSASHGHELSEVGFYHLHGFSGEIQPTVLPSIFKKLQQGNLQIDEGY